MGEGRNRNRSPEKEDSWISEKEMRKKEEAPKKEERGTWKSWKSAGKRDLEIDLEISTF